MLLTVTPVPDTVTAVVPVRLVPVRVTGTAVPLAPDVGEIEVSTGPTTVNVTGPLTPPAVVTVTVLPVIAAVFAMVNVAVIVVEFTTVTALTVTPVPDTAKVDPARKLVPARVTGTAVPRTPVLGVIDVSVGAGGAITV